MTPSYADTRGRRQALLGHGAMLAFSAGVSGSFSLGAMVANEVSPVALTTVRFLLATVVLTALVTLTGGGRDGARGFTRADFAAPWRYLVLGLLYAGYFVLMFEGLKSAHPVSAGAVFTLTPLMTALIALPLLGQRILPYIGVALLVGAAGAVWVIFRGDLGALMGLEVGRGEAIYFVGCVLHAAYTPLLRRFNRGESPMITAALVIAAGFVVLLVYGWRSLPETDWSSLPVLVWGTLAYLALVATAFTASALQFAAQRLPSSKVMAYTYLTPVWIMVWELALGHGGPGLAVLPGIALIVVALLLLLRSD